MAEMNPTSTCCSPAAQSECCEPEQKDACCGADGQDCGCAVGALTRREFEDALSAAGLREVEIRETHRVNEHAAAAIIRAVKPAGG